MAKMKEAEFLSQINMAEADAITHSENYMPLNRESMEYYLGCPNGYEVEGQSQVTSTEVADVVGSDMPSLVRFFLGGGELMEFPPNSQDPLDIAEAEEKTKYVHHIIRNQDSSFRLMHDFLKTVEIQTVGVIHYPWEETKTKESRKYDGLDEDEFALIVDGAEEEAEKQGFDLERKEIQNNDNTWKLTLTITRQKKGVVLSNIPIEQLLISSNAETKDTAALVGHQFMEMRGILKSQGFLKSLSGVSIDDIATSANTIDSGMRSVRFADQGGQVDSSPMSNEASELLHVSNLYVLIDYDGDGIPERRHVIKIGTELFHNEQFDHVPYAISSAILMPGNLMGRSRAEITMQSQLLGTEVLRSTMDNIYDVGAGRIGVNTDFVDMDSLLTERNAGVVQFDGVSDIRQALMQIDTPFIGDKNLLVMQYLDSKRAASTGELLSNQGLEADKIYNETAARFDGMRDAGAAKVELVTRVIAETGIRELFEGIAWTVSHFQSSADEIMVLGKQLTVNPSRWWSKHAVVAKIGAGAGDDEQSLSNLSGIFQIQNTLKAEGSSLVDDKDRYNTIARMMQAMGENKVNEHFNDPTIPEESAQFLMEQNQQLMTALQEMQGQLSNPLAEAEQIKAQATLQKAETDNQVKLIEAQAKSQLDMAKMIEDQRQFNEKAQSESNQKLLDLEARYTEIELKYSTDIPGKGIEADLIFDPSTGRVNASS